MSVNDLSVILQGCILAAICWTGNRIITVSEKVAVHEVRLARLESPNNCNSRVV